MWREIRRFGGEVLFTTTLHSLGTSLFIVIMLDRCNKGHCCYRVIGLCGQHPCTAIIMHKCTECVHFVLTKHIHLSPILKNVLKLLFFMCIMCTCRHTHAAVCGEVRGQFSRIGSLCPPCGSWGSNSGHQAMQQASFSVEPSHWAIDDIFAQTESHTTKRLQVWFVSSSFYI